MNIIKKLFKGIVIVSVYIFGFMFFIIVGNVEDIIYRLSSNWEKDAWGRWCRIK